MLEIRRKQKKTRPDSARPPDDEEETEEQIKLERYQDSVWRLKGGIFERGMIPLCTHGGNMVVHWYCIMEWILLINVCVISFLSSTCVSFQLKKFYQKCLFNTYLIYFIIGV